MDATRRSTTIITTCMMSGCGVARRTSAYLGCVLEEAARRAFVCPEYVLALGLPPCEPEAPCLGDSGRRGDVEQMTVYVG